jgi:hypothetical protein
MVKWRKSDGMMNVIICTAAGIVLCSGVWANEASYDVPLNEPVYRYLDMLAFPGRVNDISLSSRPFTEAQVCSLLVYAERTQLCSDTEINNFYLRRFSRNDSGALQRKVPAQLNFDGFRTYAYPYIKTSLGVQDSNYSPLGFTTFGIDSISKRHEFYNEYRVGGRLYSTIGRALVYLDASIITEYSTRRKWARSDSGDPHFHEVYAPIGADTAHLRGYDDFTAYVKFPLLWSDIKLGYDRVSWGYADSSGLLFSGIGSPFLHMKLDKTFGKLNYTFLIGKLTGDTYEQKRLIYAKHITYTPCRWLSLGYSDAIISTQQEVPPIYFLPFVPYYFSQHYIGSPDNLLMSFDGKLLLNNRWTAYGEFLIDDISNLLGIFRNTSWGDKWGGLFGVKFFNPIPALHTSAVKLEIVQIEPWVYTTSTASIGDERSYPVHFGQLLGNELGPHSRAITLDFTCQFSKKIGGELTIRQIWKGKGAGSNVSDRFYSFTDTAADRGYYATKAYRFKDFDRNRTVVTVRAFTFLNDWLRLNCYTDFALERIPSPVNLFSVGVDAQVNY